MRTPPLTAGQVFGKLTVLTKDSKKQNYWLCRCECGNIKSARTDRLKSGCSWNCGCVPRQLPMDLTGQRFGRLVAVSPAPKTTKKNRWECICDCGNLTTVDMGCLRDGNTQSCGCLQKDIVRECNSTHKHTLNMNMSGAYKSWASMRSRILVESSSAYAYYGALGITICSEWDDFSCFYRDMGDRPEGFSLDRIDPNGNYEKSNCRWADKFTQANNKKKSIKITFNGGMFSIREMIKITGRSYMSIYKEMRRKARM